MLHYVNKRVVTNVISLPFVLGSQRRVRGAKEIYNKISIYLELCLHPLDECKLNFNAHFRSALVCNNSSRNLFGLR